jgi:hypothetical protein
LGERKESHAELPTAALLCAMMARRFATMHAVGIAGTNVAVELGNDSVILRTQY